MTRIEFLKEDHKFYHVTQTSNIPNILRDGLLKNTNPFGICVIRSNNPQIIEYLVQTMLLTTDETDFSIIEISPRTHNILPEEIRNDHVVEVTNPIHNYIRRNRLLIEKHDIIRTLTVVPNSILDYETYSAELLALGIIVPFDD